jgi:hypothetical protein
MYVCMYLCMYVCMNVCIHACMYVYMYVYMYVQSVRKVAVHLGYSTYIRLSVSKLPLQCTVVSLYSVKQRLKCNTGKVFTCSTLLTPKLNSSAQRCLPRFFIGILIFKGLSARRFYKSFGVKEITLQRWN